MKNVSQVTFLLLLFAVMKSSALKCYYCDSETNGDKCEDPDDYNNQFVIDNKNTKSCVFGKGEVDDDDFLYRLPVPDKYDDGTCTTLKISIDDNKLAISNSSLAKTFKNLLKEDHELEVTECYCNTDLCNGASTNGGFMIAIAALPLFLQRLL